MARRVIDLTQPLSRETEVHPVFPGVQILRHATHADAPPGQKSHTAEVLITVNHAGTHVDAPAHFDPSPDAALIADLPVDLFCGEAICVDCRHLGPGELLSVAELERLIDDAALDARRGDILLFCTDHYNRTAGTPALLNGFSGIHADCVHWMAEKGVKIFGVEPLSPDLVYKDVSDGTLAVHHACAQRGITHYENLTNLTEVVNRRFEFYGFPLKLVPAGGSPVRAVAILDD